MVKFTNFCGIFATTFMMATAITIVSCSQDDDDYNSNMYTLAEKMETRNGGDPGGGGGYTPIPTQIPNDTIYKNYRFDFSPEAPFNTDTVSHFYSNLNVMLYRIDGHIAGEVIGDIDPIFDPFIYCDGICIVDRNLFFVPDGGSPLMYKMCVSSSIADTTYTGVVENRLFY